MQLGSVYFWTVTVKDWKHLLKPDKYKSLIVSELRNLVRKNQITVYAFVIMPNHIHLLWQLRQKNGKEMPHASFNKYSENEIVNDLKQNHLNVLSNFAVDESDRSFRIWQRDALAILMDSKEKLEQ